MITWRERIKNLTKALGRRPEFNEMLDLAKDHTLTSSEIEGTATVLGARYDSAMRARRN